ncbi:MAG: hydrogenase iron-sulfur subunit [Desulfobacterales bacterium]|nr:hydrogenase iron-sulfur subunit [Desulfobacterales bacterium]
MKRRTLIFGSGKYSVKIAKSLIKNGFDVLITENRENLISDEFYSFSESDSIKFITNAKIISANGFVGNFEVIFKVNDVVTVERADNIIISEEYLIKPDFNNLTPSETVIPLFDFKAKIDNLSESFLQNKKIAFLTGLNGEGTAHSLKNILEFCSKLHAKANLKTFVFTKNLKVGAEGLEKLYRKTKDAGTLYFKFTNSEPKISNIDESDESKVLIEFFDEITDQNFKLIPDITIVDCNFFPSPYLKEIARNFELSLDENGFIQADNVHRLPVFTNRKGIFVVGSSRSIQSDDENILDADNAIGESIALFNDFNQGPFFKADINYNRCARCLTCYRNCPYRTIIFDKKVIVIKEACYGCGICASLCPSLAIKLKNNDGDIKSKELIQFDSDGIHVFCCERSALKAYKMVISSGLNLPLRLKILEVPCAGSISINNILTCFENNASGVLILTCHEGNCHSEKGNIYAKNRVGFLKKQLQDMGINKERLLLKTIASNMVFEFNDIVNNFAKKLSLL